MKDERISFETAKLAKEKGFVWQHVTFKKMTPTELEDPDNTPLVKVGLKAVYAGDVEGDRDGCPCYNEEGREIYPKKYNPRNLHYPRPTQSLLNRWLREKHEIHVTAGAQPNGWIYAVQKLQGLIEYDVEQVHPDHEAAMEAGLQEALKFVKNE